MSRYKISAKSANSAELLIYGDIGDDWMAEESNDAKTVIGKLQELAASRIDVRINSYGGTVSDGLAIYNALKRHPGHITAHIDGVAFSVASLIPMAADNIRMADNAMMMIHAPWGAATGNAEDMREMADTLDKYADAMVTCYQRDGGPLADDIAGWLKDGKDHYFSATEAHRLGLVDQISGSVDIAAALRGVQRFEPPKGKSLTEDKESAMADDPKTSGGDNNSLDEKTYMQTHRKVVTASTQKGAAYENQRIKGIYAAFDGFVDDTDGTSVMMALRDECIDDINCTVDNANIKILAALKDQTGNPIVKPTASIQSESGGSYRSSQIRRERFTGGEDQAEKFVKGATKALEIRAGLERDQEVIQKERSSEFLSMSLLELGKYSLKMAGEPVNGSADQIARKLIYAAGPGQGTDHFPAILENIANKSIMDGYMGAEETWQSWTQRGTLNDYRAASRVNKSLFDTLDKMEEFEAFRSGRFADVKQSITGYLHGKSFSLSLQSIVNDDLSMLGEDARSWGEAANVTIGDAVFVALTAAGTGGYGQSMDEDSTILFHADHSNYVASGAGGAPAKATIQAGRTAMMTQTDPNGRVIASRPRFLLHGTTLTLDVFSLLNSQSLITGADSTQPERNAVQSLGIQGVEEYRMDDFVSTAWILAAARRTVEVAFVGGQSTPSVERMPSGEIPGITWQISIPFGVAALDYRTLYLNYGA